MLLSLRPFIRREFLRRGEILLHVVDRHLLDGADGASGHVGRPAPLRRVGQVDRVALAEEIGCPAFAVVGRVEEVLHSISISINRLGLRVTSHREIFDCK